VGEGEEIVKGAEKLGLFKALASFFKRAAKTGADDAGKDVERGLTSNLEKNATRTFPTKGMMEHYKGEEIPGGNNWSGRGPVKYLNETERQQYLLTARDGKLHDANGNPFDTSAGSSVHRGGGGRAIFVMDENGNIYASNYQEVGKFHHSSLLGGQPAAGAGELQVIDGKPQLLSLRSGHYQPTPEMTQNVYSRLQDMGVDVSDLNIDYTF
jgi:hypothetical protein